MYDLVSRKVREDEQALSLRREICLRSFPSLDLAWMLTSRAPLLQPCAISLPCTCRHAPVTQQKSRISTTHVGRAHKDRAPNDLEFGRRLCSIGLLAGVCGFVVAGSSKPFSSAPQVGSQVGSSPVSRSQLGSSPVNAERVHDLEAKLQRSGFSEKQARSLILAAAASVWEDSGKKLALTTCPRYLTLPGRLRMTCLRQASIPRRPVSWA